MMTIEELEHEVVMLEEKLERADERDDHRAVAMLEDSLDHVLEELDKAYAEQETEYLETDN